MHTLKGASELLHNRALAALIGAAVISAAGDSLYLTALPVLIYQTTGDVTLVGLAAAARLIPFLLLSMPAGVVADRLPKRWILTSTEATRCLSMLAIAVMILLRVDVRIVLLAATLGAAAGTFSMPAQAALIPELARDDADVGRANSARATLEGAAAVIGPMLGGLLIAAGGLWLAFALNGASFAIVVVVLLGVLRGPTAEAAPRTHAPRPNDRPGRSLSWPLLIRRVARPLALDAAISFAAAALGVLPVIVAVEWLDAGSAFTGALNASAGLGGIGGGLAAAIFVNRNLRRGVAFGTAVAAGATALIAATNIVPLALVAMAGSVAALVLLDTLNLTQIQRMTGDGTTGRALGLMHTTAGGSMIAGAFLPPILADTAGIQAALLLTATVIAVLGAASLVRLPWSARLGRLELRLQPVRSERRAG